MTCAIICNVYFRTFNYYVHSYNSNVANQDMKKKRELTVWHLVSLLLHHHVQQDGAYLKKQKPINHWKKTTCHDKDIEITDFAEKSPEKIIGSVRLKIKCVIII